MGPSGVIRSGIISMISIAATPSHAVVCIVKVLHTGSGKTTILDILVAWFKGSDHLGAVGPFEITCFLAVF